MLESLSDKVRECLGHAEDCVQQATSQTDPKLRQHFLILGACWLKLGSELSELARASSFDSIFAVDRRPGSSSK
jgi:hypothetical protein